MLDLKKFTQTKVKDLVDNLSTNENVHNLVNDLKALSQELKTKGQELNERFNKEKVKAKSQAVQGYAELIKYVNRSQNQLDSELKKALEKIKVSAKDLEKNLNVYRGKLSEHKEKVEKIVKTAKQAEAKTTKKASTKKTSTRKSTKHTTSSKKRA